MPNQDNRFCPPPEPSSEEAAEPPLIVSVANQTECSIDVDRVTRAAELAMAGSPYVVGEISIAIVDDSSIHELNRQFLDHDYPTDVLSFPLVAEGNHLEGEIVVSVDTAAREAREVGWSTEDELLLYVVHGALHLAGFGDKHDLDAQRMRQAEQRVLAQLGVDLSPRDARWSEEERPS